MTCIVGVKHNGKVYIGGDSASVDGYSVNSRRDRKVFKNTNFLIGFAGSFRMGQIMRFNFKPPKHKPSKSDYEYMCTDFVKKMQTTFEANGFDGQNKRSEKETCGQILVGYRSELYEIGEDYQVGVVFDDFNAIGIGYDLALGSLYTSCTLETSGVVISPEEKIKYALDASSKYNGGVLPPYTIDYI